MKLGIILIKIFFKNLQLIPKIFEFNFGLEIDKSGKHHSNIRFQKD